MTDDEDCGGEAEGADVAEQFMVVDGSAEFGAISGVRAGALAAVGGFVQRPIERDLGQVESDT